MYRYELGKRRATLRFCPTYDLDFSSSGIFVAYFAIQDSRVIGNRVIRIRF